MAENTAANHGEHFNESIVNEVILEDMKKNRIDHMKYLPGMETMEESDVMEKVITAMNAYDYDQYTEKDVRRALEHDNRTIEDFQALLSPAALPLLEEIAQAARVETRKHFGNSVYMFTPIYIANYCENYCIYCGFNCHNKIRRAQLNAEEIEKEMEAISKTGLQEILILTGESRAKSDVKYIGEACKIARKYFKVIGLEVYPMNSDEYHYLHECGADYVTVFQETYHKENYESLHPTGPKSKYAYHTEAMDRAMEAGIDDVGLGVLFGLNTYRYDFTGLLMHAEHLEATFGVGPHTISVPRICPADDISTQDFPDAISDDIFCKIVAVIRIAVPYTGMIISTRESAATRRKVLNLGISQISGGSRTSVGGYAIPETPEENSAQFDISDTRTLDEVVNWLLDLGHIPSFCTACYRAGRTGDRFMSLVKSGQIANCCAPNALMTLKEYLEDYAAPDTRAKGIQLIKKELEHIPNPKIKEIAIRNLKEIEEGKRDFRF